MKNPDRIYAFFIVLALGFWNPATFWLLYANKPAYHVTSVHQFYWLVFLAGCWAAWTISKGRAGKMLKNTALLLSFTGMLFALLVTVNIAMGRMKRAKVRTEAAAGPVSGDERKGGLVFEPRTRARYKTTEFDFEAIISSIGLRNAEVEKNKGDKFRILCFGDSWTFGWGVDEKDSWPRQLEGNLKKAGFSNVEVINCGRGGQYTTTYLTYMKDAVPALRPDLVLVGVLELDDLAQIFENSYKVDDSAIRAREQKAEQGVKGGAVLFLENSLGHVVGVFRRSGGTEETIEMQKVYLKMARDFYTGLDRINMLRYNMLDKDLRDVFMSGNLNPGLVDAYVKFPERPLIFNDPTEMATQFAMKGMEEDIRGMKDVCTSGGASLIFINLPMNYFNGHKVVRSALDPMNSFLELNNRIDSMYAGIAGSVNVPYIQLTDTFKALTDKNSYYFKYDGHPNKKGYMVMADYIAGQLIARNFVKK